MTHSEAAPCTAETNANWIDSLLRDWRAGRKKRPRNGPRRRNFGTRRPMGEEITLLRALQIRQTPYTSALEGAAVGDGQRATTCKEGRRKRSCQSVALR